MIIQNRNYPNHQNAKTKINTRTVTKWNKALVSSINTRKIQTLGVRVVQIIQNRSAIRNLQHENKNTYIESLNTLYVGT